ncbi:hypothetical protein MIB92_16980 [Aestuariirhabdus sp. Z084]|uniref:hypothetical protein n=1 Tax=Aestuariirhabdus haliotis TaxID=2918751 RepID=UPI0020BD72A4|nr:hypothetical protein [Aestuariirhabdus haliotis]MCL6417356.1 hypothetical protein [Aestuariirhabdus haliotis]
MSKMKRIQDSDRALIKALGLLLGSVWSSVVLAENTVISSQSDLVRWCKSESEQFFLAQVTRPYNWTASRWQEGNILKVKGDWLVGSRHQTVYCSVLAGSIDDHAVLSILSQEVPIDSQGFKHVMDTASTLSIWCKSKSAQHFLAKNLTPENWSGNTWIDGNFFQVEGSWTVDRQTYLVSCRARKGVAEKYATMNLTEQ